MEVCCENKSTYSFEVCCECWAVKKKKMRALHLLCILLHCGADPMIRENFDAWQTLTEKWFLPGESSKVRKGYLKQAFKKIKPVVRFFTKQETFPPGLDPLQLAQQIIGLRQKQKHIKIALPLINAALDKYKIEGEAVRARCHRDSYEDRRTCQDAYGLLCNAYLMLNASHTEIDAPGNAQMLGCVKEYNKPRGWSHFCRAHHSVSKQNSAQCVKPFRL